MSCTWHLSGVNYSPDVGHPNLSPILLLNSFSPIAYSDFCNHVNGSSNMLTESQFHKFPDRLGEEINRRRVLDERRGSL